MPEYTYLCDINGGGCGHMFSVVQRISKYRNLKKCPECKKHRLIRDFSSDNIHTSSKLENNEITLGHLANRNSSKISDDQKQELYKKHNAYKEDSPSLPEGMERIEKSKDKPWYRKSKENIKKLANASEEQKKRYIRDGKI